MFSAFKKVILDTGIQSVGGMIIPLCSNKRKFEYLEYSDVISDPIDLEQITNIPKTINFGTAETGAFSIDFSSNITTGGDGKEIGMYFLQGKFGICFPRGKNSFRNAHIIEAETPAFWFLNTNKKLGSSIRAMCMSFDHCGLAGEALLKEKNYKDALYCYEQYSDREKLKHIKPQLIDRYFAGYSVALFNSGKKAEALKVLESEIEINQFSILCKRHYKKMKEL